MRNYILADNQELTRFALESLLRQDKEATVYRASDKASLVALLKEHEAAVVLLDYTLFDFSDEDQLLIVAERFSLSDWILISDELTSQFLRRVVYSSHQFSIVFKDGPLQEVREALRAVGNHQRYISQRALEVIISQQQNDEEQHSILTETETEIVRLLTKSSSMPFVLVLSIPLSSTSDSKKNHYSISQFQLPPHCFRNPSPQCC